MPCHCDKRAISSFSGKLHPQWETLIEKIVGPEFAGHQIALETSRQTPDPACLRQVLAEISRHNPNGSASSVVSRESSVRASADDTSLTSAMKLLERVSTIIAVGAKGR